MYTDGTGTSIWSDIGNWFKDHWKEAAIGAAFIIGGALVTALTCGAGTTFWAAFGSALLTSAIQVGTGMAVGVAVNGLVNISNDNNFFDNVGNTLASSFMWGGILSGGSQMLSGVLRFLKQATGFSGYYSKSFSLLNADKVLPQHSWCYSTKNRWICTRYRKIRNAYASFLGGSYMDNSWNRRID